jgi:hypothetical protein
LSGETYIGENDYILTGSSCTDGVYIRRRCSVCNEVVSHYEISYHSTFIKETINMSNSNCSSYIEIEKCPCGYNSNYKPYGLVYNGEVSAITINGTEYNQHNNSLLVYSCNDCDNIVVFYMTSERDKDCNVSENYYVLYGATLQEDDGSYTAVGGTTELYSSSGSYKSHGTSVGNTTTNGNVSTTTYACEYCKQVLKTIVTTYTYDSNDNITHESTQVYDSNHVLTKKEEETFTYTSDNYRATDTFESYSYNSDGSYEFYTFNSFFIHGTKKSGNGYGYECATYDVTEYYDKNGNRTWYDYYTYEYVNGEYCHYIVTHESSDEGTSTEEIIDHYIAHEYTKYPTCTQNGTGDCVLCKKFVEDEDSRQKHVFTYNYGSYHCMYCGLEYTTGADDWQFVILEDLSYSTSDTGYSIGYFVRNDYDEDVTLTFGLYLVNEDTDEEYALSVDIPDSTEVSGIIAISINELTNALSSLMANGSIDTTGNYVLRLSATTTYGYTPYVYSITFDMHNWVSGTLGEPTNDGSGEIETKNVTYCSTCHMLASNLGTYEMQCAWWSSDVDSDGNTYYPCMVHGHMLYTTTGASENE